MKPHARILFAVLILPLISAMRSEAGLEATVLAAARNQATNSVATFQGFITPENFELLGFASMLEASTATNADPLLIYTVPLSRLKSYDGTNDFSSLLYPDPRLDPAPVTRVIAPVMAGTNVRSSISLRLVTPAPNPRWTNANWGYPNLIQHLVDTARSIPPALIASRGGPFIVEVPVFDVWFIGYLNTDNPSKLVLVSTANMRFGSTAIFRRQVVTPTVMYEMRVAAHRYDGHAN